MEPDGRPLFLQIAESIEDDIVDGRLSEENQAPSTNEFAAFHRINPATAGKGMNLLVERGILYKRRGIGMFVSSGARARLLTERRTLFRERFLVPLRAEATKLGIGPDELVAMLDGDDPRSTDLHASAPVSQESS